MYEHDAGLDGLSPADLTLLAAHAHFAHRSVLPPPTQDVVDVVLERLRAQILAGRCGGVLEGAPRLRSHLTGK